jgi:hypothetical protein
LTGRTRLLRLLATSAAATALALGALTTTASAATATIPTTASAGRAVHATASAGTAAPAVCGNYALVFWGGSNATWFCTLGFYYAGNQYGWPVTRIDNDSSHRIWLHQFADGSGWSLCLTGNAIHFLGGAYQDPGNILVSANTAPC